MHTTEESSLIQLAAYSINPCNRHHYLKSISDWPAKAAGKENSKLYTRLTKLVNPIIFVPFQLRRFEDCSDNGLWPQWFSLRLGSPGAACVVWAAVSGVNYDNMMNLRSKCLNSVVFCLLFSNSLASAWSSCGSSLWHVASWEKWSFALDPLRVKGKHPIKTCHWSSSNNSRPQEKSNLFCRNSIRPDIC